MTIIRIWVLLEIEERATETAVRVCGTTIHDLTADKWVDSRSEGVREAIRVPLDALAKGETW